MRRLLFLSITLFIFLILVFLFLSYVSPLKESSTFEQKKISTAPLSILYFKPSVIYSSCNGEKYSIPIFLNTAGNQINGAQIELSFDPKIIFNTDLAPANDNVFGPVYSYSVSLQEVRDNFGRASLAILENPQNNPVSGNKNLAVFSFQIKSFDNQTSVIDFVNKSTVFGPDVQMSLLKVTAPLTIYCSKRSLPSSPQTLTPEN